MHIDIFSDTICPWCFIGKRRLERALEERPQPDLTVRWRAFQLNPDMPSEGMERGRYLELKFGGALNAQAVYAQVRAAGESEGIPFAFERIARTPNTVDSHRLIRFAEAKQRQDEIVEALFAAYFLRGENIGEVEILVAAAEAAGLDPEEVRAFLNSDAEADVVRAEDAAARRAGINGVPCFIFNGHYALAGAHPPEILFRLFDLANEEGEEAADEVGEA
ncbi:MAG: DsbA family oxidoreductase [Kiloniellaceae bacterium]